MYLKIILDTAEDLKLADKIISDYGKDCKAWEIEGTIYPEEEDK